MSGQNAKKDNQQNKPSKAPGQQTMTANCTMNITFTVPVPGTNQNKQKNPTQKGPHKQPNQSATKKPATASHPPKSAPASSKSGPPQQHKPHYNKQGPSPANKQGSRPHDQGTTQHVHVHSHYHAAPTINKHGSQQGQKPAHTQHHAGAKNIKVGSGAPQDPKALAELLQPMLQQHLQIRTQSHRTSHTVVSVGQSKPSSFRRNDCRHYYSGNGCRKADQCTFRHEPAAIGNPNMCFKWKNGTCDTPHCRYRHANLEDL